MKKSSVSQSNNSGSLVYLAILFAGMLGNILLSPKWVVPVVAWLAPGLLLFYFRNANIRFRLLWFSLAVFTAQIISSEGVAPFPLPILAITSIIELIKILLVYSIDRWITKRNKHFITTLVFPVAYVTKEFIDLMYSGGAWWSIANTQYSFSWFIQLSSVTGILGISFMIYWFASVLVWSVEKYRNNASFKKGAYIYAAAFSFVIVFGAVRYYNSSNTNTHTVKIAGVTAPSFGFAEAVYKDVYGKTVTIDPKISQASKELQEINTALVPFIEDPASKKFTNAYHALDLLHDSLFALSKQAVDKGAQLIVWSEGNGFLVDSMQPAFTRRAQDFAAANKIYLLATIAAITPGKVTADRNFLENKAVFIGPDGNILNVFHKNHPVPFAEHSVPGDGKIPAVTTPFGIVSPSICYDADIPAGMEQLAKNKTDILLLPSGDWYDIAPYHSYMAMFRGIENGCTVARQASGGLSLVTDYRGKTQSSFDFYTAGEKLWTANITTGHVTTIYSIIGDSFSYLCIVATIAAVIIALVQAIVRKRSAKKIMQHQEAVVM